MEVRYVCRGKACSTTDWKLAAFVSLDCYAVGCGLGNKCPVGFVVGSVTCALGNM